MSETELWFAQLQKELRVHNPPNDSTHVYYSHTKYEQQTPTGSALTKIQVFFRQFRDLHETFIKETLCKSLTELVVFRSFGAINLRPWYVNMKSWTGMGPVMPYSEVHTLSDYKVWAPAAHCKYANDSVNSGWILTVFWQNPAFGYELRWGGSSWLLYIKVFGYIISMFF